VCPTLNLVASIALGLAEVFPRLWLRQSKGHRLPQSSAHIMLATSALTTHYSLSL